MIIGVAYAPAEPSQVFSRSSGECLDSFGSLAELAACFFDLWWEIGRVVCISGDRGLCEVVGGQEFTYHGRLLGYILRESYQRSGGSHVCRRVEN